MCVCVGVCVCVCEFVCVWGCCKCLVSSGRFEVNGLPT